ncbi:MAG: DUF3365 domain-containing protein [Sulfuricurvum sp.]|jgi:hypothetical protein|uniref:Tll0287-like domain-containing protein n=1 Tax=Sulfuricurvum sp. TaxID=2025608 RepID=UPI0025F27821|nr:DUF3365 domain-containing protein [Sulfuricurvum sp.]MCK9373223.1 DUF3365 domain-containing protein [Sulfuricurvum sp.]
MYRFALFSLSVTSSLLLAQPFTQEEAVQHGSAVSAALVQRLSTELKGQMELGGPMAALRFCSLYALSLTDHVAKDSNATLKRVSLHNRNPVNAPTADEKKLLEKWEAMQHANQPLPGYETKRLENGDYHFYKPILITNEACLKCHGEIAAGSPLAKAIKAIYPDDKATGYKMGNLRGMIVVTLPNRP